MPIFLLKGSHGFLFSLGMLHGGFEPVGKGNYFLKIDELGQVDLLVAEFEGAMTDA